MWIIWWLLVGAVVVSLQQEVAERVASGQAQD